MMKSSRGAADMSPRKLLVRPHNADIHEVIGSIAALDSTLGGGVKDIIFDRRSVRRGDPIGKMMSLGYEEIHQIGEGFCAYFADEYIERDWRMTSITASNSLRLRIGFAGSAEYLVGGVRVSDTPSYCSFVVQPEGVPLTANYRGGINYRFCALNLTQQYLDSALRIDNDELPAPLTAHWSRHEIAAGQFPASKSAQATARRYFAMRSKGSLRDVEIKAISLDFLHLLLACWRDVPLSGKASLRITPSEKGKLVRIQQLIESNPDIHFSIDRLCADFDFNRNQLNQGFKLLFGVSVHAFQTERRMTSAMDLLNRTSLPVSEVADRAGYAEPTNFTAAFKKYFSILPSQVRKYAR